MVIKRLEQWPLYLDIAAIYLSVRDLLITDKTWFSIYFYCVESNLDDVLFEYMREWGIANITWLHNE